MAARAEPVLGMIQYDSPPDGPGAKLFLSKLAALGLVEGRNLRIERRYADERKERYAELVEDLSRRRVNAVVAFGHDIAKVGKQVAPDLPIIAFGSEDPLHSGLVKSLSRPGGQVTGVTFMTGEIAAKRLEILKATIPRLARPSDVDGIPEAVRRSDAQAVFIVPSRITQSNTRKLARLLLEARIPSMAAYHTFVEAGGLISYGADIPELFGPLAVQVQRVLAGTKPGDLPVELPNRIILVLNRSTAAHLGVDLPASIVYRADRVIE